MNHLLGAPGPCAWRGRARGTWLTCGLALLVLGPIRAVDPRAVPFRVSPRARRVPWGCSCGIEGSRPNTRLCVMKVTHARFRSHSVPGSRRWSIPVARRGPSDLLSTRAVTRVQRPSLRPRTGRHARREEPGGGRRRGDRRPGDGPSRARAHGQRAFRDQMPSAARARQQRDRGRAPRGRGGLGVGHRPPRRGRDSGGRGVLRARRRNPDDTVGLELRPRRGRSASGPRAVSRRRRPARPLPPFGHCDSRSGGGHLGSQAIVEAVKEHEPSLVLCGHIHESWGQESAVGPSRVMNLGPWGALIDV